MHDYGFRYYDPAIARFTTIDPLADSPNNNYITPYHFVANNPISNIDPDGLDWYSHTDDDGNTSTLWVDSSDKSYLSQDGTSYQNIGTSYTETLSDGSVVVYDQNEVSNVYEANDQGETLMPTNIDEIGQFFGDMDLKIVNPDLEQQALMDETYQAGNWFGVSPSPYLQREEERGPQLFPYPKRGGGNNNGKLGAHKKKKQSTGSTKRLNDKHTKKRSGETPNRNRKNQRRGKKNKKYTPKKNPNKRN